ncbi:phage late control protein, partial [Brevibacillus formosus]
GAKGVYSDFIEPFVKDGQYMLEDTQGGMWTRSIEESYEKGRNRGKQDLVIAELLLSRGAASAYKQGAKKVIDLEPDGDAQRGKRDSGIRTGILLDGADNNRNSSPSLRGGKLKTQAKSFTESFADLQKEVNKLLKQMGNMLGGVAVFREAYTGEYRVYFVRHDDLAGGNGGGGGNHRRGDGDNEGTGTAKTESIPPEKLLGIKHANILNPRDALYQKVQIRGGVSGKPASRHLTKHERNLANQILDDISAQARGDASARARLEALNDHVLENRRNGQNYAGWNSVYIRDEYGNNGVMRIIYRQTSEGIEWNVVQWH